MLRLRQRRRDGGQEQWKAEEERDRVLEYDTQGKEDRRGGEEAHRWRVASGSDPPRCARSRLELQFSQPFLDEGAEHRVRAPEQSLTLGGRSDGCIPVP